MPKYLTGLVTTDFWMFPPFPYRSRGWSVELVSTAQSRRIQEMPHGPTITSKRSVKGRAVVIKARNESAARKAAFLIQAAAEIWRGGSFLSDGIAEPIEIVQYKCDQAEKVNPNSYRCFFDIPLACMLAIKASRRREWIYAVSKLWLSYRQFSVFKEDLDPSRWDRLPNPKSPYPFDHVAYSQAIVLAYGVLEQLGLEIRASSQNPSFDKNGAWNPNVRGHLEGRLRRAGIDLTEQYAWDLRGSKTRLERERPPKFVKNAPWSQWNVRDGFVEVIDAIAHVSWLRSKVSAHKSKYEFMRALSVYDVANAQYLARRLLLESFGFWKNDHKSIKEE